MNDAEQRDGFDAVTPEEASDGGDVTRGAPVPPPSRTNGLGSRLAELRVAAGLGQEEVARAIGVTWMTVSRWERGVHHISLTRLYALADMYAADTEELRGLWLKEEMVS